MPYENKWTRLPGLLTLDPPELADWFRNRGGWRKNQGTLRLSTPWKEKKELEVVMKLFKKKYGLTSNLNQKLQDNESKAKWGKKYKKPVDIFVVQSKSTHNARLFFSKRGTEKMIEILTPFFPGKRYLWFDGS